MPRFIGLALALLLAPVLPVLAGCRTSRPSDLSVAEHRQAAADEREKAAEDTHRYDPDAEVTTLGRGLHGEPLFETYNPTERYLRAGQHHQRLAKAHEKAAAALGAFEDEACKPFPPAVRAACPVLGTLKTVEKTPGGARVQLLNAGDTDAVVAHIRCHIAFGDAHGDEAVEGCPLYIRGLTVSSSDGWIRFKVAHADDKELLLRELNEHLAAGAD